MKRQSVKNLKARIDRSDVMPRPEGRCDLERILARFAELWSKSPQRGRRSIGTTLASWPGVRVEGLAHPFDDRPDSGGTAMSALGSRHDAIVSYHPPIFRPTKWMLADRRQAGGLAAEACPIASRSYSRIRRLDCTRRTQRRACELGGPGTCDALRSRGLDESLVQIGRLRAGRAFRQSCRCDVCRRQGGSAYERCSYRSRGTGTHFRYGIGHNRHVGQKDDSNEWTRCDLK